MFTGWCFQPSLGVTRYPVWGGNPTLRQLRRVLILVDLQQVRHVMEEVCHSDAMSVTRVGTLPGLHDVEEDGIFTYARFLQPSQLRFVNTKTPSPASVDTSSTLGVSRSTLMNWTYGGVIERATPLPFVTTKPSFNSLRNIDRGGHVNKMTGPCFLLPLLLDPVSHTS